MTLGDGGQQPFWTEVYIGIHFHHPVISVLQCPPAHLPHLTWERDIAVINVEYHLVIPLGLSTAKEEPHVYIAIDILHPSGPLCIRLVPVLMTSHHSDQDTRA